MRYSHNLLNCGKSQNLGSPENRDWWPSSGSAKWPNFAGNCWPACASVCSSRVQPAKHSGVTLLEILIALGVLAFSYVVLVTTFMGAGAQTAFTAEHYTAMFLIQKVFEDTNQRLSENPHFFSELISDAEGDFQPVVDGNSKYFRLLENTKDFNFLRPGEDDPIATGSLYLLLKPFQIKVSTLLSPDPITGESRSNLAALQVTVRWNLKYGGTQEYSLTQFLTGTHDDMFKQPLPDKLTQAQVQRYERLAVSAWVRFLQNFGTLWNALSVDNATIAELVSLSGNGERESILAVGKILFLLHNASTIDGNLAAEIAILEKDRDQLAYALKITNKSVADRALCLNFIYLQKTIAETYQRKAQNLIHHLHLVSQCMNELDQVFAYPSRLGQRLSPYFPGIIASMREVHVLVDLPNSSFSAAEKCYLSLTVPPFLTVLPRRKEPGLMRKTLDIQKICVLMTDRDSDARKRLRSMHENIKQFTRKFDGQNPAFLDFLSAENELTRDLSVIRANYAGVREVFALLNRLPKQVDELINRTPERYR